MFKVPFLELGSALVARGHNVTLISAFPPSDSRPRGSLLATTGFFEEIAPLTLVSYVHNFTDWDLMGARMAGKEPVSPIDIMRYGFQVSLVSHCLGHFYFLKLILIRVTFWSVISYVSLD